MPCTLIGAIESRDHESQVAVSCWEIWKAEYGFTFLAPSSSSGNRKNIARMFVDASEKCANFDTASLRSGR